MIRGILTINKCIFEIQIQQQQLWSAIVIYSFMKIINKTTL